MAEEDGKVAGCGSGENMVFTTSEVDAKEPRLSQTIYVAYETLPGSLSEVDMFGEQFVLQTDDSDVLTSMFCGDVDVGHREITIASSNAAVPEGLGNVRRSTRGDEEQTYEEEGMSSGAKDQAVQTDRTISCDEMFKATASGIKVFSSIRVTILCDFQVDENLLENLTEELCIEINRSSDSGEIHLVGSNLSAFIQLEEIVRNIHESGSYHQKFSSKSTETDEIQVEKHDKGVACSLLLPQFTRSGREIRRKDYDLVGDVAETESRPTSTDRHKNRGEAPTGKRKRGRPPKNVQKLDDSSADCVENGLVCENRTDLSNAGVVVESGDVFDSKFVDMPVRQPTASEIMGSHWHKPVDRNHGNIPDKMSSDQHLLTTEFNSDNSEVQGKLEPDKTPEPIDYESRAPFKHCTVCSFRTKRKSHLHKHIQLHDRNIPILRCTQCTFSTTRQNHLTRHEMQHKSFVFRCERAGCAYQTDNRRLLRRHESLHRAVADSKSVRPNLACPVLNCTYRTNRAHLIRRHLVRHTEVDGTALVEKYSCSACSYETQRREHYLRHVKAVHLDQRPYLCDHCGCSFKRKDSLVQHGFVHQERNSRLYRFECRTCNAKFRSQGHLNDHKAKHSTDRSYLCEICGSAFKTKAVQKKHILSIHSKPQSHVCSVCSKKFNTSYALRRHAASHNSKHGNIAPAEGGTLSLSNAVQVAVLQGLTTVDSLQGTIAGIDSQFVTLNVNAGQILVQAPRMIDFQVENNQNRST